jgi:septal ring factor EnvC (AmiA/AmiB activator)
VQLNDINQYLGTIALLIGIVNALWLWLSRPAADINKRIDKVDERFAETSRNFKDHDRRIQAVESEVSDLPTKTDLHALAVQLTGVKVELDMISRVVMRIDEHLRTKS